MLCAAGLVATSSPALAAASHRPRVPVYSYARHYVPGQVARYAYTEDETQTAGGQTTTSTTTAADRVASYVHRGTGGEQVRWVALTVDGTDMTAAARSFPAYDLSLDPRAADGLTVPDTSAVPGLVGPVTDLTTFYVPLSAQAGIGALHRPGQSETAPTLLSGNFASAAMPVGQDLLQLTTTLTSLTRRQATLTSDFVPPPAGGLTVTAPFMDSPVCGTTPNNFEEVQQSGTAFLALWGCEQFTATTVADRASGRIVSASLSNPLQLSAMECQDAALTQCTDIGPVTLQRTVTYTGRH